MDVIVDVEMFSNNVVKELAFCCGTYHAGYLFKPPMSFVQLSQKDQNTNRWITRHLHSILWTSGDYEYKDLGLVIQTINRPNAMYYAKGKEKCKLLSTLFNKNFNNLEDYDCPSIKELPHLGVCDSYSYYHNKIHSHCAQNKAVAFADWLLSYHDLFEIV